jgi:hypothetical protein
VSVGPRAVLGPASALAPSRAVAAFVLAGGPGVAEVRSGCFTRLYQLRVHGRQWSARMIGWRARLHDRLDAIALQSIAALGRALHKARVLTQLPDRCTRVLRTYDMRRAEQHNKKRDFCTP